MRMLRTAITHLFAALTAVLTMTLAQAAETTAPRYNVLFIAVDDLRPQTGCYGDKLAKTPNIDRLAESGLLFNRAYCQQALCCPTRSSLLTGRRPDSTKVYDLYTHFRKALPNCVTLPEYFKQHGYHTQAHGKIYHGGFDDPQSWTVPLDYDSRTIEPDNAPTTTVDTQAKAPSKATAKAVAKRAKATTGQKEVSVPDEIDPETGLVLSMTKVKKGPRGPSWEAKDVQDNALPDGQIADRAVATMQEVRNKPFFLAVGFHKPHLPFIAPKKYYDMHSTATTQIAPDPDPPKDVPAVAMTDFGELRLYSDIPKTGRVPDEKARELIRAYHAASSYTDAQIGRVLAELDRLGLRDKTIIILWGDHGWQLGEHNLWCKHTNFELAARAPLIISVPGMKNAGKKTEALVEFVDIYPTLLELCGFDSKTESGLEGTSFVPLLENPQQQWKSAAFSQYPRPGNVMGRSMRTDQYRYTEWANQKTGELVGVELYDHKADPQEDFNIALKAENADLTASLSKKLKDGWKAALPGVK